MFHYMFFVFRRQAGRSALVGGGFLLAACALILLSATTQTTVIQASQIISRNWRPTYDLVVLPPNVHIAPGTAIPPDQFAGYAGGISMQQYEQIKQLPGIAVAAPLAFISYAQFPTTTVEFGSSHLPFGFYRLEWTLTAFNGQRLITEYHTATRVYASDSCQTGCSLSQSQQQMLNSIGVTDYFFPRNGRYLTVAPTPGDFLIAAIDPEEENQLVHLDKSIIKGGPLPEQQALSQDSEQPTIQGIMDGQNDPNYDVPLLMNTQPSGQIALHATFVRLSTTVTDPQQVAAHGGSSYLDHLPSQTIFDGSVPIPQNDLRIFAKGTSLVQHSSSLEIQDLGTPSFSLNFTAAPSTLTYQPSAPPPGVNGPAYALVPSSTQDAGAEVAFRNTSDLPGTLYQETGTVGYTDKVVYDTIYNGDVYTGVTSGQFDGQKLSAEFSNALNWLPENT